MSLVFLLLGLFPGVTSSEWRISASYFHPNHADGSRRHDFVLFEGAPVSTSGARNLHVAPDEWQDYPCILQEPDKRHNIMSYRRKLRQKPAARVKVQVMRYSIMSFRRKLRPGSKFR